MTAPAGGARRRLLTRALVADYVLHRLERNGLEWPPSASSYPAALLPPEGEGSEGGRVERAMRALGAELEERYKQVFSDMCDQLHITPNNAHGTFVTIVGELFRDDVRWGRVVALFAFAGCLAVQCVQKEMPVLVDQVVEWTAAYVDTHLTSWVQQHGNWEGLVEFYESGSARAESPWPSLSTLCGYAVGALGVLTLGAILSRNT